MLIIQNVFKSVSLSNGSTLQILADVNLTFNAGSSTAIRGPSGSGKSSLLSLMGALDVPSSGQVRFEGRALHSLSLHQQAEFRARNVGIVFQDFHLIEHYSALQNVWMAAEIAGMDHCRERACEQLEKVGLQDRLSHFPHQLSGGEQQRVAIARATVSAPKLLLCDEPTGNLDPDNADKIISLLIKIHRENHSCLVVVTHDQSIAQYMERTVTLTKGRVHESPT